MIRGRRQRLVARTVVAGLAVVLLAWAGEWLLGRCWPYPLARLAALERSTVVTAADGTWLQVWPTPAGERVIATRWHELAPPLRAAILCAEDERFFDHAGVDAIAVARAALQNVTAGRVVSGASTLTMQVVRIVEPRPRTFWSKLTEAVRARQLERAIGKAAVLDLWVTHVPMGGTLRGMEAAARHWFGCSARDVTAVQAATLVAMVPAPSARAPHRRPELLRQKRNGVLGQMAAAGALTPAALAAACAQPLGATRHPFPQLAWHECTARLRTIPPGGQEGRLATGLDAGLQARLEELFGAGRARPGDGAVAVVLSRADGEVQALVGDAGARAGTLDLARCRRSVGSTLKPFLYALAHEQGVLAEGSLVDDAPVDLGGWRPHNFDGRWSGRGRAEAALAASANLPAVTCLQRAGLSPFLDLLAALGLPLPAGPVGLDAALGTLAASPLELARAWQRFVAEPGDVGLSPGAVDWVLRSLAVLPLPGGGMPPGTVAWKSGTSSGRRDAWCVGVTGRHVVVVWLGNRAGQGTADLVGAEHGARLLADVLRLMAL